MLVYLEKVIDTVIDYCEEEELWSVELTDRLEAIEPAKDLNELFELASQHSRFVKVWFSNESKEWIVNVTSVENWIYEKWPLVYEQWPILYNVMKKALYKSIWKTDE